MPNIKICGFDPVGANYFVDKFEELMNHLAITDAVISIDPAQVVTCDARRVRQPYVQIAATKPEEIKSILDGMKLLHFDVDVEWLVLGGFMSAKELYAT